MANLSGFDATSIAPREDFTPLPTGEYIAVITDSEMKPTKKGGEYLECAYEVKEGQFKGRKVWSRHNLVNTNPKTVEIAQRELSAICHAVGVMQPRDSQDLHYKPMILRVEFVPADGDRQMKDGNEVKAWKKADGAVPSQAPAQAQPAAASAPPWQRGQQAA